jgi:hypothetical protein
MKNNAVNIDLNLIEMDASIEADNPIKHQLKKD